MLFSPFFLSDSSSEELEYSLLSSPLQLAVMTARIASGRAVVPRLVRMVNGKEVPVPEYTTQLIRDLALWKLCGIVSTTLPQATLTEEQSLTAAGIVAQAWGKMTDTLPPCTAAILSVGGSEEALRPEAANAKLQYA